MTFFYFFWTSAANEMQSDSRADFLYLRILKSFACHSVL
jgi:hypothetical protein